MGKDIKQKQAQKAKRVARAQLKGERRRTHKTHTGVRFHRPATQTQRRHGKYARSASALLNAKRAVDHYAVIRQPLNTEKCLKKMEDENTMVFLVDPRASKFQIRASFEAIYSAKVRNINTLIRPDGQKKAYIKLSGDSDALPLANKIGLY